MFLVPECSLYPPGEGLIHGGLFVVNTDGGVAYSFKEKELGDHAPIEDVLVICKGLVSRPKPEVVT